jgi:hypothetical protein
MFSRVRLIPICFDPAHRISKMYLHPRLRIGWVTQFRCTQKQPGFRNIVLFNEMIFNHRGALFGQFQ